MLPASLSTYRTWIYVSLGVLLITAWYSVGFYHPDEHFQVLEFTNYKLGLSPSTDLPWEFTAKCRPALQPLIAFILSKLLLSMGAYNPFTVAFLLRVLMAMLTWWVTLRAVITFLPEFKTSITRRYFVLTSFFLWFIPYFGVRFTAECISGNLLLLAITLLYLPKNTQPKQQLSWLLAGFCLGLSLYLRLQIGFAIVGLGIWLLFIKRCPLSGWLLLLVGGLLAIGTGLLADRWFYGVWVLTPYNYFDVNILKNVAAKFGVDPWWHYFVLFFNLAIPPLSIVLLLLYLYGTTRKPAHVLSLMCVTFFIGHFAIGHKEMRFLLPVTPAFIFIAMQGLEAVSTSKLFNKAARILLKLVVGINIAVLVFKMFTPAEEVIKYYRFVYSYAEQHKTTVLGIGKSPFLMDPVEVNFYKPSTIGIKIIDSAAQMPLFMDTISGDVVYISHHLIPPSELANYKTELLYTQYPDWLLRFNVNHWQERSYLWAVFRITKK